jgi:hypothetical protein
MGFAEAKSAYKDWSNFTSNLYRKQYRSMAFSRERAVPGIDALGAAEHVYRQTLQITCIYEILIR